MKNNLRARRQELGKTLLDVANEIGVREATVSKWERGEVVPSSARVIKIEKAYKAKWANLMGVS